MKAVGLFRVSTERQENEGASLDAQQRRYRDWCQSQGAESVGEFRGQESAAKAGAEREVLQQVLRCIREQNPDVLFVIEQSRLTRGDELEVALLVRELRERGIKVAVGGSVRDLGSIDDTLAFGVQSLVDRAEHARICERTARGRREKALQGKRTSRPPYGFRNPPRGNANRGTLQVEESEAQVVRQIFGQIAAGEPFREIAARLNALGVPAPRGERWSKSTVQAMSRNPSYLGDTVTSAWHAETGSATYRFDPKRPGAVIVHDTHEAIVSPAVWAQARAMIQGTSTGLPAMLTGMLYVGGRRANVDRTDGRGYYVPQDRKPGPWVRVSTVNDAAWAGFGDLFREPDALLALLRGIAEPEAPAEDESEALARQEAKLRGRLERYAQMRADGELTKAEYAAHSEAARRAILDAQQAVKIAQRRAGQAASGDMERAILATKALVSAHALGVQQKRRVMRAICESVHVEVEAQTQARGPRGLYFGAGPKWQVTDLWFRLYGCAGLDPSTGCYSQTTVPVRPHANAGPELLSEVA